MTETTTITPRAKRQGKAERIAMLHKAAQARKAKQPKHEADAADEAMIPQATGFVASVFVGRGKYVKREAATLEKAREQGRKLAGTHGRKQMIYAIMPERSPVAQVFVPDTYQAAATTPQRLLDNAQGNSPAAQGIRAAQADAAQANGEAKEQEASAMPKGKAKTKAPKAVKPAKPAGEGKKLGSLGGRRGWAEAEARAKEGKMPPCPDFSAPTHNSYRKKLEEVHAMAKARDLKALQRFDLPRKDSSRSAIMRYRDLCIVALKAAA